MTNNFSSAGRFKSYSDRINRGQLEALSSSSSHLPEPVVCLLAEEYAMQVIFAFLTAKHTMQHIFETHYATCLLLAQQQVNDATCSLFLAKRHTMQRISMTCLLPGRKDKHCALIPPCSPKFGHYNMSHACLRKTVSSSSEQRKQTDCGLQRT